MRRMASRILGATVRGSARITGRSPRVIFTYHKVGKHQGAVAPEILEAQITAARNAGFEWVPPSRMCRWAAGESDLPPRAAALTFDDGLRDTARVAGPILRRHGVSAMVFPVLGFLGGPRRFASAQQRAYLLENDGHPQTVAYDYMDWDELDAWVEGGGEVGGHTLSHPFLGEVDAAGGRQELRQCRHRLSGRYGQAEVFCYPYGDDSGDAAAWVREAGFMAAVTSREGVVVRGGDSYRLPRLPAPASVGRSFHDLLYGIFRWRARLRQALG